MSREEIMDDLQEPQQENYELEEFINEIRKYYKTHEFKRSVVNDCVSRQAAIYAVDSETVSTNPEHFKSSEKFIKFMDNADIASFGKWQWANGFNTALTATSIQLKKLPFAQPEIIRCKDCKHFEYDHPYIIQDIPVLGHEVCNAWGNGCKTDENGYCFMAERANDGR